MGIMNYWFIMMFIYRETERGRKRGRGERERERERKREKESAMIQKCLNRNIFRIL